MPAEEATLQIVDEQGKQVLSKSYDQQDTRIEKRLELMFINVSELASGGYFLIVSTKKEGKVFYSKFIKL